MRVQSAGGSAGADCVMYARGQVFDGNGRRTAVLPVLQIKSTTVPLLIKLPSTQHYRGTK